MFGKDYYNIGFVFNEGKFRAADLSKKEGIKEFTVPVYKKNSLTNALSLPGINAFFIDLRTSDNLLFSKTQSAYCFGECYSNYKRNSKKFIPNEHYDGLIYISNTRQSVAIPPG
jgi:erythromycin esterase-like protein